MLDFFEDYRNRQRMVREKAEVQPLVEVTGIIPPRGASLVQIAGSPAEETVIFHIWRVGTGPLENGQLRLVQEIAAGTPSFASLRDLAPETAITIKARLLRADDEAFALAAGDAEIVAADPIIAHALHVQKSPATHCDPLLGTLKADLLLGWVGNTQWLGAACELCISRLEDVGVAHALWKDQQRWTSEAIGLATDRLLGLKNEEWLGEGERPVSPAEFGGKLTLTRIEVGPDGAFILDFDDGGLFRGHTVTVQGSLSDGLTDVDFVG